MSDIIENQEPSNNNTTNDTKNDLIDIVEKLENKINKFLELEENMKQRDEKMNRIEQELNNMKEKETFALENKRRDILIKPTQQTEYQAHVFNMFETEKNDRLRREMNLIIYGLPQSNQESDDKIYIQKIFQTIGVRDEFLNDIEKVSRFPSKTDDSRPIPLCVTLKRKSENNIRTLEVIDVLRLAHKLRTSQEFNNIFIMRDLTVSQRILLKKLIIERNIMNHHLDKVYPAVNYRYGIRNDKIVIIKR